MDPFTGSIIAGLATNYFTHFTAPAVQRFFEAAFNRKPSLEKDLKTAKTAEDFVRIFHEAAGVIDAAAGTGSIAVDGALLEAARAARFDHQHGTVEIAGSVIRAAILQTGGEAGASGTTHITDSSLNSGGTRIDIGKGASIRMTGGASIRQN
jgi:hypothetical protein